MSPSERFLEVYLSSTRETPTPYGERRFVCEPRTGMEVLRRGDDAVMLDRIETDMGYRRKGSARRALEMLCAIADMTGCAIELYSAPIQDVYGGYALSANALLAFYRSLGFAPCEGSLRLRRTPRARAPSKEAGERAYSL